MSKREIRHWIIEITRSKYIFPKDPWEMKEWAMNSHHVTFIYITFVVTVYSSNGRFSFIYKITWRQGRSSIQVVRYKERTHISSKLSYITCSATASCKTTKPRSWYITAANLLHDRIIQSTLTSKTNMRELHGWKLVQAYHNYLYEISLLW